LKKQRCETIANGVSTQPAQKSDACSQSRQPTGHVGGCPAETIVDRTIDGRITSWGPQPIDQGFPKANHRQI
jgi:hypothetical protein